MQAIGLDPGAMDWQEYALRFAAFLPGVHTCIVGTRNVEHLRRNVEIVARGPLPEDETAAIREAFARNDDGWMGET
jgi:aryl-alcohol dehydrogenase-like predicted oxidoreductase